MYLASIRHYTFAYFINFKTAGKGDLVNNLLCVLSDHSHVTTKKI